MSGLITGVGSERYSILCYWLIPDRNVQDGISIIISWVRGSGVKGTKGLECRSNGLIIFDWYFSYCVCATVLLLAASVGLFVLGRVVLAFLFVLVLFHRRYRRAP